MVKIITYWVSWCVISYNVARRWAGRYIYNRWR